MHIFTEIDEFFEKHTKEEFQEFFLLSLHLSLEEIKYMIELGADPRGDNDMPVVLACCLSDINVVTYFINEYGADIYAHNNNALYNAIRNENKESSIEITRMLLDNGIVANNSDIKLAIQENNYEIIKLLVDYGTEPERIIKIFFEQIFIDLNEYGYNMVYSNSLSMLKFLNQYNVDLNQIISQIIK